METEEALRRDRSATLDEVEGAEVVAAVGVVTTMQAMMPGVAGATTDSSTTMLIGAGETTTAKRVMLMQKG